MTDYTQEYLREKDVEKIFSITRDALRKARQLGYGIPYFVLNREKGKARGGIILYKREDVERFINKNKKKGEE